MTSRHATANTNATAYPRRVAGWIVLLCCTVSNAAAATGDTAQPLDSKQLSQMVTIHRDAWGVPHILGPTDECVVFGMGYAQAEDYFWQLEDTTIRGLGRYAEVYGPDGIKDDLLNRAFEVVPRSKADYEKLPTEHRLLLTAFTGGINWYLERHPETPTRLLKHFEPWMVMAVDRHLLLDFTFGQTHAGDPQALFDADPLLSTLSTPTPLGQAVQDATGSNAGPSARPKPQAAIRCCGSIRISNQGLRDTALWRVGLATPGNVLCPRVRLLWAIRSSREPIPVQHPWKFIPQVSVACLFAFS